MKPNSYQAYYIVGIIVTLVLVTIWIFPESFQNDAGKKEINASTLQTDPEFIKIVFQGLKDFDTCYWNQSVISTQSRLSVGPSTFLLKGFIVLKEDDRPVFTKRYFWSDVPDGWTPSLDTSVLGVDSSKWVFADEKDIELAPGYIYDHLFFDIKHGILYFEMVSS